jgi:hypothetical protein
MPNEVHDTPENMEICKKFCGPCPSFKSNKLNESPPMALFCARGASTVPKDKIKDNGCSCFGCGVFQNYKLEGGWFCIHGKEGKKP